MTTNEEDFVEMMINSSSHDYILFFTNNGKVYRMKGYEIPEFGRQSKGLPIINLLNMEKGEKIASLLKVSNDEENNYFVFATKLGIIKRTDIAEFNNIRTNGKKFITLKDNDELISAKKTSGNDDILMASSDGRIVRFPEEKVRVMGRGATGVKGINLGTNLLVGMEKVDENQNVLVITENGYGKQTSISEYRITNRGSKGVKTINITEKNGAIVSFKTVTSDNDVMIITNTGVVIRLDVDKIPVMSRVTQGVKLINVKDGQMVSSAAIVDKELDNEDNEKDEQ